ncbi:MAG: hypothetical protein K8J08_15860 [Thermoanaerobaculia bacterium]|nr:hypothetical protein [Thermoanaerobaculia bacterium]
MNDFESHFARSLRRWGRKLAPSSAATARIRVLGRLPPSPRTALPWRGIALATAAVALIALVGWGSRPQAASPTVAEDPNVLVVPPDEKQPSPAPHRSAPTLVVVTLSSGTEVYIALGSNQPST